MTFAEMFVDDAEPLRNPDQGAGTSVLERPETKESPVRDDGGDADRFAHYVSKDRIAESRATRPPRWWPCAVRFGSPSTTRPSTRFAPTASGFTRK